MRFVLILLGLWCHTAWADVRALVIAGLGGELHYSEDFRTQATRLAEGLSSAGAQVTLLTGDDASASRIRSRLDEMTVTSEDWLIISYTGHGSYDGKQFRFNVPGRDFTATDLADWLTPHTCRQLVVIASSASGAAHEMLADPNRMVMTATRSGREKNATRFHRFFAKALSDTVADTNKDSRISVDEAYRFAESTVTSHYTEQGQLATEQPRRSGPELGLTLARLTPLTAEAQIEAELTRLERAIIDLRSRKANYPEEEYFEALQLLLLEVAEAEQQFAPFESPDSAETEPDRNSALDLEIFQPTFELDLTPLEISP